ncbi:MAG: response regulator transcription factor, partial [Phycicoccus sp.]
MDDVRVLVVEDEPKLADLLRRGLAAQGLAVDVAICAADARWMAASTAYDAITLDVMLPDGDGVALCRSLREDGVDAPVLLLTALGDVDDRVSGLDSGADDYLVKPFAFPELLARLRALVRRGRGPRPALVRVGDLVLDPAGHAVSRGGVPIPLTPKEFALLEAMMRRPGEVVTRYELLESAWDDAYDNRSNIVDVYVGYLRQKVDRPFGTASIRTVRGVGYTVT